MFVFPFQNNLKDLEIFIFASSDLCFSLPKQSERAIDLYFSLQNNLKDLEIFVFPFQNNLGDLDIFFLPNNLKDLEIFRNVFKEKNQFYS